MQEYRTKKLWEENPQEAARQQEARKVNAMSPHERESYLARKESTEQNRILSQKISVVDRKIDKIRATTQAIRHQTIILKQRSDRDQWKVRY